MYASSRSTLLRVGSLRKQSKCRSSSSSCLTIPSRGQPTAAHVCLFRHHLWRRCLTLMSNVRRNILTLEATMSTWIAPGTDVSTGPYRQGLLETYKGVCANIALTDDISFKLLGIVPLGSGLGSGALVVLEKTELLKAVPPLAVFFLSAMGALITVGASSGGSYATFGNARGSSHEPVTWRRASFPEMLQVGSSTAWHGETAMERPRSMISSFPPSTWPSHRSTMPRS
jgi:hypothetical protein